MLVILSWRSVPSRRPRGEAESRPAGHRGGGRRCVAVVDRSAPGARRPGERSRKPRLVAWLGGQGRSDRLVPARSAPGIERRVRCRPGEPPEEIRRARRSMTGQRGRSERSRGIGWLRRAGRRGWSAFRRTRVRAGVWAGELPPGSGSRSAGRSTAARPEPGGTEVFAPRETEGHRRS